MPNIDTFNIEALRAQLRKMPDDELLKFGESAAYLCAPENNPQEPPREVFVIQLHEARAEWAQRKPAGPGSVC